jgi:hypothetical protein
VPADGKKPLRKQGKKAKTSEAGPSTAPAHDSAPGSSEEPEAGADPGPAPEFVPFKAYKYWMRQIDRLMARLVSN